MPAGPNDIIQSSAMKVPYGALGTSDTVINAIAAFIVEFNKHRGEVDYFHPSLYTATDVSTVGTPNANTLVKRNASAQSSFAGIGLNPAVSYPAIVVTLPAGEGGTPFNVMSLTNNGTLEWAVDQLGNETLAGILTALGSVLKGTTATNAATVLSILAPPTPSADIASVANNAGSTKYWRVNSSGNMVVPNGVWTADGTQILDSKGNVATPRSNNEFAVTLSPSALTAQSAAGRYGDINGLGVVLTPTTVTATSHGTLYIWWTWSYGVAGAVVFTANTAGGNTVSASATKANFPIGNKRIGYILVPPGVTNLSTATFDDWRNTEVGDGNSGAGGGAPSDRTYVTTNDETGSGLANAIKMGNIAAGQTTIPGPVGLVTATTLAAAIRSGFRSSSDYDNTLADRLFNDNSPGLAASMSMSGLTLTLAASANNPQSLHVAGRWRTVVANLPAATSGTGQRFLIADLSGNGPGFTISWSSTSTVGSFQKVIAQGYCNGTTVAPLDTSPIQKIGPLQYTPFPVQAAANPSGTSPFLGASLTAPMQNGPLMTVTVPSASIIWLSWIVNWTGSAIGNTRFQLISSTNGGSTYSLVFPSSDVIHVTSGNEAGGNAGATLQLPLTAGSTIFSVGGIQNSGAAVIPAAVWLYGLVFGS